MGAGIQQFPDGEGRAAWADSIPADQWDVYCSVLLAGQKRGLRFALGGAFALATYTGHWRNTKDLDLFILPDEADAWKQTLTEVGLTDYFDELEYDRSWIYRAHRGEIIVDVIWSMANHRATVDPAWLSRGPELQVRGERVRILPVEEVIWNKLYILHRERCDWPDVLNLVFAAGPTLDWHHLLDRLGEDVPLVRGLLSVFTWLCPGRAALLPHWLWGAVQLPPPGTTTSEQADRHCVDLLDTRPWFTATIKER